MWLHGRRDPCADLQRPAGTYVKPQGEKGMENRFGEDCLAYKQRTPFLSTRLWNRPLGLGPALAAEEGLGCRVLKRRVHPAW
jgi:hypothetical protein